MAYARLSGRAFAVFCVSFAFLVMLVSGALLYVAPKGRLAQQIDWHLLGLGRDGWEGLHIAVSVLFTLAVIWHFVIHLRVFGNLLGGSPIHPKGHRREAWIALALLVFLSLGALAMWPPSSWLIEGNEFFKHQFWEPSGGRLGT